MSHKWNQLICGILTTLTLTSVSAFAIDASVTSANVADGDTAYLSNDSNVVFVHEDVSPEVAQKDNAYSAEKDESSENTVPSISTQATKKIYWNVKGWEKYKGALVRPCGSSVRMKGDEILSTYHYTRTYYGRSKRGDSGRIWGNKVVTAYGSYCDYDVADAFIHYVKYGTSSK